MLLSSEDLTRKRTSTPSFSLEWLKRRHPGNDEDWLPPWRFDHVFYESIVSFCRRIYIFRLYRSSLSFLSVYYSDVAVCEGIAWVDVVGAWCDRGGGSGASDMGKRNLILSGWHAKGKDHDLKSNDFKQCCCKFPHTSTFFSLRDLA